ncbi:CHASE2 domain-containing sensor protein [Sphingomonas vulcanisoli]|uniref:CHASE2 domain-containing sensor protein n=1 Tax=Sphingomonas vulcanisoli TaxID=1658060 RepID=A0ABX0TU22_9SPHN|nr:CcdC protein domain-containing protein [Sphingomonas vulcanisoli]NIJ07902.1 CHASE2 domain-containing sensor protein [Sphingomonas vulcanisoli]
MHAQQSQTISYIITAIVIGLVMVLRFRRIGRAQRLNLNTLWIVPALLAAVLVFSTFESPPRDALGWLWLAAAAAVGALLGWRRGKLMHIHVDPATGTLNQTVSPAALLFFVLLIIARQGLRYEAAAYGVNMLKITGILMALATGLVSATRVEMYLRAKRILASGVV